MFQKNPLRPTTSKTKETTRAILLIAGILCLTVFLTVQMFAALTRQFENNRERHSHNSNVISQRLAESFAKRNTIRIGEEDYILKSPCITIEYIDSETGEERQGCVTQSDYDLIQEFSDNKTTV